MTSIINRTLLKMENCVDSGLCSGMPFGKDGDNINQVDNRQQVKIISFNRIMMGSCVHILCSSTALI